MRTFTRSRVWDALFRVALVGMIAAITIIPSSAQQTRQAPSPEGYISGVVESTQGREAGVWVIAETSDLLTKFIKIVVTDDQGRFVLPELPTANYKVWVRGYGLADSAPVQAKPGAYDLSLKAVVAKTPQEAAKVYPANYWYSLLEPPAKNEFPGTGPKEKGGNGIATTMKTQAQWIDNMKQGCTFCHQLGNQATREMNQMKANNLTFKSSVEAWDYRVQTGQRGAEMTSAMTRYGRERGLKMFADWTDKIAAGAVPPTPPRPTGVERNVVITMRDWGTENSYMHDEITTDKRDPKVNAGGPVYAISSGHGNVVVVDPVENSTYEVKIPTASTGMWRGAKPIIPKPSNYWGNTPVWTDPADPHNPMLDGQGRLWLTSMVRNAPNPDWCKDASLNKFAAYFPLTSSNRHASYYDPKTSKFTLIETCFGTHHLQFDEDPDQTLYFSGGGPVIPWINTKMYDQTKDAKASQGWCPTVLDTNGDGKITKPWNEPVAGGRSQEEGGGGGVLGKIDPKLDTRVDLGSYVVMPSPIDNSVWVSSTSFPGHIIRFDRGANPPETCMSEIYRVPNDDISFGPRGLDVDRNGVVWSAFSGSSHLASFDRKKCKVFKGPTVADGKQCTEGWTLYQTEGPKLKGTDVPADFHYTNWVDQFNTLGLGANVPLMNGSNSDSLIALLPEQKKWINFRVPYPMGFFQRGMDGRIDNPNTGWKGKGLWANYGTNFVWHIEGGKGTKSKMVHFQLRPDPLAH